MGWDMDPEEPDDGPRTFLQAWVADLARAERHNNPAEAARLRAEGPPEPAPNEPRGFKIVYYDWLARRGDQQAAEMLELLRAEGRPDGDHR